MPRYDSKIFQLLQMFSEYLFLNLLYLAACIPIITVGPATVAMHAAVRAIGEQEAWFPVFRQQFRSSFRTAAIGGMLLLVSIASLGYGLGFLIFSGQSGSPLTMLAGIALFFVLGISSLFFLFYSRFSCTLGMLLRNAMLVFLAYPLRGIANVLLTWMPLLLAVLLPITFLHMMMIWLLVYFTISAVVRQILYKKPFDQIAEQNRR